MKEILEQQRADGFPALAGSELAIRIPITEIVLNEVIQATAMRKGSIGPLTKLSIRLEPNNRISIPFETTVFLMRQGQINAVLAPKIDFEKDARLLIMLAPSGAVGWLLKLVLGHIDSLKDIMTRSNDNLFVNIRTILVKAGAGEYLPYIETVRLRTDQGILFFDLYLSISEKRT